MKLTIPGNPISKLRPRFSRRGNFVATYDVQGKEIKNVQNQILRQIKEQFNSDDKSIVLEASEVANSSAFRVEMRFYMEIPNHTTKSASKLKLWGVLKHNTRPDTSNCIKFYEDCLNGILYHDDSQIVELYAFKAFSENPRTEIFIMPIKTFTFDDTNHVLEHFTPCQLDRFFRDLCYLVDSMRALDLGDEYDKVLVGLEDDQFAKKMIEFSKKYSPIISKIGKLKIDKHEEKS